MKKNIFNTTEKDEQHYLEEIKGRLEHAIAQTDAVAQAYARDAQESREYLWENKAGMDHAEKLSVRQSIYQISLTGESAVARKKRLAKLLQSPYFGRIDFTERGEPACIPLYIGIHAFYDQTDNRNFIHDWRAPVSGMFYDFELGNAHYQTPEGRVEGKINLKRQYRIRGGVMEFMIESAVSIYDDILQKELSNASGQRMKNIVATIQRHQNAIIRNEKSRVLIIQGVAGSGKTSVALHRIAFLLYRFKETIKSEDILIISPNKVFADYISNVLPELGEEKIREIGMEELAGELLEKKCKFQTFFEQVSLLLTGDDKNFRERILFKSGAGFLRKLNEFLLHIENEYFSPQHLFVKKYPVPSNYIEEKFRTWHRLPMMKRIAEVANDIVRDLMFYNQYEATAADKTHIRRELEKMFTTVNLRQIYKHFYDWMDRPDMLKLAKGAKYEYADVFPLIYLKMQLEGIKAHDKVKHLVVDEMQDYTPLQYTVLARIFACNKTILGDSFQSVNPFSSSDAEAISEVFAGADLVKMTKSYRSTYEITRFAQRIRNNPDIELIERHGEEPSIITCRDELDELQALSRLIADFETTTQRSLGIICKTQSQADTLYDRLANKHERLVLLDAESHAFSDGQIICAAHMAKGLEFDQVIIPFATDKNYQSETDRQMLYVAATRAMHGLVLTHFGHLSPLIA
jgi:DNA helicase II / ATP-dependent DNA helicase PcrA